MAVVLLLLTASPFTAPFSTFDTADIDVHTSLSGDHGDDKKINSDSCSLSPLRDTLITELSAPVVGGPDPSERLTVRALFALRL